jgi:hypothetical protein
MSAFLKWIERCNGGIIGGDHYKGWKIIVCEMVRDGTPDMKGLQYVTVWGAYKGENFEQGRKIHFRALSGSKKEERLRLSIEDAKDYIDGRIKHA